ncbi:MAG: Asp-tRNA(Asn)/Glu-tRNA(Gln) amidotransferase subunit GatA [Myxococcales bacterium]|nr:Asp-tRNA(Asn)/Glu-tRNA(Gln) amidotransferase subunit GatA [Myxococcales bacterium]
MTALVHMTATELAAQVRARAVSARAVTDAFLGRVDATDAALGAYVTVDHEGARAAADALDRALADGADGGPLAGVPVAIKDVIVTRDLVTTAASKILAGWVPPYDATAVARLRAAGAIILGKTNCDEFGMGSTTEHAATRTTVNPWAADRVPGGSSGGSAAAVAAASAPLALGTDTGGSIRQPAAFCGVVGLKPTYGRVSRWGAIAYASSLDQIGPMAATVADAALALEVIAGLDPRDATSIDLPAPALVAALARGVRGLRVGLPREYLPDDLDADVAAAVARAAAMLADAGATVVPMSLPHTRYALPAYYVIAPAEAASNLARYDGVRFGARCQDPADLDELYARTRGEGFGPEVIRRIMIGTYVLRAGSYDAYYRQAQQVRALVRRDFDEAFADVDVVLAPVAPTPAWPRGATPTPLDMYRADVFTLACNLAGLPGLALPCGATAAGLPLGVQLLGRPLDEATLCAAGAAIERARGPAPRAPWPEGTP